MNWSAITFDWNQARAFLATAEAGSLSGAARALGLTQPTLSRQVAGLEDALGVTLFERVGRALALTQSGRDLLEHFRAMGEAAEEIALRASGQSQAIEGLVRVTATDLLAGYLLAPMLRRVQRVAPGIEIEIVASNSLSDLRRREADIAVRHARPQQSDLIARLVSETSAHLYAASAYLDAIGRPQSPQDVAKAEFVSLGGPEELHAVLDRLGLPVSRAQIRLSTNSGMVGWDLVRRGLGITAMAKEIAELTPEVEPVLPTLAPLPVPVWLATHRELRTSRRIRLVYDILVEGFRAITAGSNASANRADGAAG
jgi:DNA-binding transcriptional LysR family regulator